MRRALALLLLLCACEPGDIEAELVELGRLNAGLRWGVYGGGWDPGHVWSRGCWYLSGSRCFFPSAQAIGDPWVVKTSDHTTGWPAGYSQGSARENADDLWSLHNDTGWEFTPTGCTPQNPNCTNLHFVNNEALSGNLDPNVDQNIDRFARAVCVSSTQLAASAQWPGVDFELCHRIVVMVDVGSFTTWVNGWTSSSIVKQNAMDKLYGYFYGLSVGVGGRHNDGSPTNTLMYRTFFVDFPSDDVTDAELCQALDINSLIFPGQAVWEDDSAHCD